MPYLLRAWAAVIFTLASVFPASAEPSQQKAAAALRASSCRTCHGDTGDSPLATTPRLNGQSAGYLWARLQSFRYPIKEAPRTIHNMGVPAAELTDGVIRALVRFYAGQEPFWGAGNGNAEGASIYRNGAKDVPACQTCHGAKGDGRGATPRLAGQHKDYLQIQLQAFAMGARIGDPMNHHVWVLPQEQAQAIAAYLGN